MRRYYEPTLGLQLFLAGSTVMIVGLAATIATVATMKVVAHTATKEVAIVLAHLVAPSEQVSIPEAA